MEPSGKREEGERSEGAKLESTSEDRQCETK